MSATESEKNRSAVGWGFVLIQAILLIALVVLPTGTAWPTPGALIILGGMFIGLGLVGVAIAALRLGPALTPTPVPTENGAMITGGLYRFVRHPIYTAVLVIVIGLTVRSGSLLTLIVAGITVVFFNVKAQWEEARLSERYVDYQTYAAVTPRFIPRVNR